MLSITIEAIITILKEDKITIIPITEITIIGITATTIEAIHKEALQEGMIDLDLETDTIITKTTTTTTGPEATQDPDLTITLKIITKIEKTITTTIETDLDRAAEMTQEREADPEHRTKSIRDKTPHIEVAHPPETAATADLGLTPTTADLATILTQWESSAHCCKRSNTYDSSSASTTLTSNQDLWLLVTQLAQL